MSISKIQSRETLLSLQPFTLRRRVTWGECDAAGVVYTPRFGDFTADTSQLFMGYVLGQEGFMQGKKHHEIGTPCKALSFVFHSSLRPDEYVDMQVQVGKLGSTTFELLVKSTSASGMAVFDSTTTLITVAYGTRQAIRVPDSVRAALQPHCVGWRGEPLTDVQLDSNINSP